MSGVKGHGKCRHCSRRVAHDEGRIVWGRAEHDDCATSIARMDANRRRSGHGPLATKKSPVVANPWNLRNPSDVKVINTATGEITRQPFHQPEDLARLLATAATRPRTLDERRSVAGGGRHD